MIKLIATDMDGTFLDDDKKFDKEFLDIFFQLKQKDIKFVIASGNQYYRLYQRFLPMSKDMLFVSENGSYIALGETILQTNTLTNESVKTILSTISNKPSLRIILCGVKKAYVLNLQKEFEDIVIKHYCNYESVTSFEDIDDEILKVSINDANNNILDYIEDVKNKLPDNIRVVTAGNEWMDIQNNDAHKGNGLKFLQEKYNISPDECMAFGDQMNDYEMLQSVKYGYAMDNAVDKIKEIAYDICPSNKEQGVLQIIKDKVLKDTKID